MAKTFIAGEYVATVKYDEWADSPRAYGTSLGTMVLAHKRYTLPFEGEYFKDADHVTLRVRDRYYDGTFTTSTEEPGSWAEYYKAFQQAVRDAGDEIVAALPVYMLDHSGLAFSTPDPLRDFGKFDPFRQYYMGMDSGQVGYIFATRKAVLASTSVKRITKATLERVYKDLRQEVEDYDTWSRGLNYLVSIGKVEDLDEDGELDVYADTENYDYTGWDVEKFVADLLRDEYNVTDELVEGEGEYV